MAKRYMGAYIPFFALGILISTTIGKPNTGAKPYALMLAGIALCGNRALEEANKIAISVHQPTTSLQVGFLIAMTCFAAVYVASRSINHPALARLLQVLGSMSYPLYLMHQNAGYELINSQFIISISANHSRPAVMTIVVMAAFLVARWVEPALLEVYKHALRRW